MIRKTSKRDEANKIQPYWRTGSLGLNLLDNNYWGDSSDGTVTETTTTTYASTTDSDVVVKQFADYTINSGVTITTNNRCKGLVIYCSGNCTINGTLTMTAKGAYSDPVAAGVSATGLRFIRKKTGSTDTLAASDVAGCGAALIAVEAKQYAIAGDGKIYTIARAGGAGGNAQASDTSAGNPGTAGGTGQTGGGGGGAKRVGSSGGAGTAGTCFSGGTGGGGNGYGAAATGGTTNGGPGGNGQADAGNSGGGGAGNAGGIGESSGGAIGSDGETGTGGFIALFVRGNLTIGATGVISSAGKNGGGATGGYGAGGGASGGGVGLILYGGTLTNSGSLSFAAGTGGVGAHNGGAGGAGSYVMEQILV